MKENIIGKSIEQSQSLKDNPKFIDITTEGFVIDGYLDEELKKARKVISREDDTLAGERLLPWLYTQDSEQEVWNGNRKTAYGRNQIRHLGLSKSGNTWKNRWMWQGNQKLTAFLCCQKISTSNRTARKPG